MADAGAPAGKGGTFLLDPKNITIATPAVIPGVSVELLDPNPGSNEIFGSSVRVLSAQGKKAEALEAYKVALARLDNSDAKGAKSAQDRQSPSNTVYRELLQQKLDSLGGGKQ